MIAIQSKAVCTQSGYPVKSVPKEKKRSISTEPLMLPTYNARMRVGPSQVEAIGDLRHQTQVHLAKKKNMI